MPMVTICRIELVVPDKVVCHDADHGVRLILHSYSDARHCGTLNAKIVRIIMCMGRGSQMKKSKRRLSSVGEADARGACELPLLVCDAQTLRPKTGTADRGSRSERPHTSRPQPRTVRVTTRTVRRPSASPLKTVSACGVPGLR